MVKKRKECGVPEEIGSLFALPYCLTHYREDKCLKTFADECGAQRPDYMKSTRLSKDIASTSQILNLKACDLDQRHDISVPQHFYRLPEPTIQSVKISKLLLALGKGKLHELRGK